MTEEQGVGSITQPRSHGGALILELWGEAKIAVQRLNLLLIKFRAIACRDTEERVHRDFQAR